MKNEDTKSFTSRKFPSKLHKRMKLIAVIKEIPLWQVFNEALEKGTEVMEKEMKEGEK